MLIVNILTYTHTHNSWKENPHERPTFRGLANFFRQKSFAAGTLAHYDISPTIGGRNSKNVDEASAKSAALINEAVRKGKKDKKKRLSFSDKRRVSAILETEEVKKAQQSMSNAKKSPPDAKEVTDDVSASYVDLLGKVRSY